MRLGKRIVDDSCNRASLVLRHQALALPESERHHHPVELKTEIGDREGTKNNSKVCMWDRTRHVGGLGRGVSTHYHNVMHGLRFVNIHICRRCQAEKQVW